MGGFYGKKITDSCDHWSFSRHWRCYRTSICREKVLHRSCCKTSGKIRSAPDLNADVLGKIWAKRTVDEYTETDGWVKIGTTLIVDGQEKYITGWIRNQYVEK